MRLRCLLFVALAAPLIACDSTSTSDAGGVDSGAVDAGGTDAGPPDPSDVCDELGLERFAFDSSANGTAWDEPAGDFTAQTTEGPWTLSEHWTGCDSYVFINHSTSAYGLALWSSISGVLFSEGPRNVHYFFTSFEPEFSTAETRVRELADALEAAFESEGFSAEDRAFWRTHIHFVTTSTRAIEGSVGALLEANPLVFNVFGITRGQRWDPAGLVGEFRSTGFTPLISMARYLGPFYDYLAELDARVSRETDVTVVPVLDEAALLERVNDRTVTLPDSSAMGAFDTLEVDVEIICRHNDLQLCSEWDRIASVHFCEDTDCTARHEIVRWITPYWRNGRRRWVMDASPFLGFLRDGGETTFRVELGPTWEAATERDVRVSLRMSDRGGADRAVEVVPAFTGGSWNADYNTRDPLVFTPPSSASRVEVVSIISGHGQESVAVPGGGSQSCAEWCSHEHSFRVAGQTPHQLEFPFVNDRYGCAARAAQGVVPGQGGNWAPARALWCPGLPVPTHRIDITADLVLGAETSLGYIGTSFDQPPVAGSMSLSAYIVYYE